MIHIETLPTAADVALRIQARNILTGRPPRAATAAEQARADHPSVPVPPARRARRRWWPL